MSGTTLVRTTLTGVRPLGVRGEPLHHAHAQLRAIVRKRLSERHFHLLAEPQPYELGGRIDWYCALEGEVQPISALPESGQQAARGEIDGMLADIDRLGQSLEQSPAEDARLAGKSLRLAAKGPSDEYLFLVGEQPIVVCWGYDTEAAGAMLSGAPEPGLPATLPAGAPPAAAAAAPPLMPTQPAWAPLAVPSGTVALARQPMPWLAWLWAGLLAILVLLLASWLLRQCMPVPPELRITTLTPQAPPPLPMGPDPTAGFAESLDASRQEEEKLKATLVSLRDAFAERHRQCTAPVTPKPPEPPPKAEPKPRVAERTPEPKPKAEPKSPERRPEPPPKTADRKPEPPPKPPDGRMRMPKTPTNDYSFLKGCWRTDSFKHGPRIPSGYATYCFDANGRGTMEFRFDNGTTCRAPATARYAGSTLRVVDADSTCSPRGTWAQDRLDCTPGADGVAFCRGENRTEQWTVNLHRVGGI